MFYPFGSGAELLWTNSAPTVAFNAQTVALDLSQYVGVGIIARATTSLDDKSRTVSIAKVGNTNYNVLSATNASINITGRPFKASAAGVVFLAPYYSATPVGGTFLVPIYIFGLKNMLGFEDYLN